MVNKDFLFYVGVLSCHTVYYAAQDDIILTSRLRIKPCEHSNKRCRAPLSCTTVFVTI